MSKDKPDTIGARIRAARTAKEMTQHALAVEIGLGSGSVVSSWESQLKTPDTANLIKLADALGVSVDYLARGTK